jgi:hypothetical protein
MESFFSLHLEGIMLALISLIFYLYSDWKGERCRIEQNKRIDMLYNMHFDSLQGRGAQKLFKWKE